MPKKKAKDWEILLQALVPKGHRWRDVWHLFSVILDYIFDDKFESPKHCLVYIMYHANWLDTNFDEYNNLTNQELADITDRNLKLPIDQETIYAFFGTSRNTFKKNFANYLDIPKQPRIGELVLIYLNKWQDSRRKLAKPVTKKQLTSLEGMYHKKIAKMFVEVPQAQDYLNENKLDFKKIRQFPPSLIEYFFEEIGELERFNELVLQITKNENLDLLDDEVL